MSQNMGSSANQSTAAATATTGTSFLSTIPVELRERVYEYVFPDPIEPDYPIHDLNDELPSSTITTYKAKSAAQALSSALPDTSEEVHKHYRRCCTKLTFTVLSDELWKMPDSWPYTKELKEIEIFYAHYDLKVPAQAQLHTMKANMVTFVSWLNKDLEYMPLLRIKFKDVGVWIYGPIIRTLGGDPHWSVPNEGGPHSRLKFMENQEETIFAFLLSPLWNLETKVLEAWVPSLGGVEDDENMGYVRTRLERSLERRAGLEMAARRRLERSGELRKRKAVEVESA